MQVMAASELRNHYAAVEEAVATGGPVFLTKNGYGSPSTTWSGTEHLAPIASASRVPTST